MKPLRVWILCVALVMSISPATTLARGHGGGHGGGGWHGGGGRGGWHGGGGGFRPFQGGHWGWAPWWGVHAGFGYPGYLWPYGVPWVIYPAWMPGYSGAVPEAVPILPPSPAVVLHTGEMSGMNVGLRFQWQCDNPQVLVPSLESAGELNMALVLRGNAAGEANCVVGDGETPPLHVHVVVLPQPSTPTGSPP